MEGTVCGRCGSPASIAFAPATLGPLAAQALLSGYWWIRPGGSALAWASIAAAAVATRAGIWLVLEPGPVTGPFAAAGLAAAAAGTFAPAAGPPAAAGPAAAAGTFAPAAAGPPAAAGLAAPAAGSFAAAVVAGAVARPWPAWGAMGARPR